MIQDIVHAHVHLVQESRVEEVTPFRLGVVQAPLRKEGF